MANTNTYTNSPLAAVTILSPNHSGTRTHVIDRITPHCVVGQATAEAIAGVFKPTARQASCNYGIGRDGKIALICEEKNRSWCSSSWENDQRAITIEVASDTTHPYAFRDAAYNALIDLCTDICRRNGKTKLLWFADKAKTISYQPAADEMVLTAHRWFANKACPGDWMYSRMGDLADKVTARLNGSTTTTPTPPTTTSTPSTTPSAPSNTPYLVRITNRLVSIKKGPGTNYSSYGYIQPGVYTIVDEQNGWGLLKAYAKYRNGWIPLNCVKKV